MTLYHGDSAEIIPTLDRVTLTITDPPYANNTPYDTYDDTPENLVALIASVIVPAIALAKRALITPGNSNVHLYPVPTWTLAWVVPSGVGRSPWGFTCWQPVLAYGSDPYLAAGLGARPDIFTGSEGAPHNGHPCPKPIEIWQRIITRGSVSTDDVLFDPFVGGVQPLWQLNN